MTVEIEYTNEFGAWWEGLDESEQESIDARVRLLEQHGPHLGSPHSSGIAGSKHSHMRELRIQHRGDPYRIRYAFNPKRNAILLIGSNKKGNDRWYLEYVPMADRLYDEHLAELGSVDIWTKHFSHQQVTRSLNFRNQLFLKVNF